MNKYNRKKIRFEIKRGYYLELLTLKKTKLLGSTKSEITKDKNGENVPHLEITEIVLIQCNIASNDYQQDARVLYTIVPNNAFGQLLDILPKEFVFLKTFDSKFLYIEGLLINGILIKILNHWKCKIK